MLSGTLDRSLFGRDDCYAFCETGFNAETILIAINRSANEKEVDIPAETQDRTLREGVHSWHRVNRQRGGVGNAQVKGRAILTRFAARSVPLRTWRIWALFLMFCLGQL